MNRAVTSTKVYELSDFFCMLFAVLLIVTAMVLFDPSYAYGQLSAFDDPGNGGGSRSSDLVPQRPAVDAGTLDIGARKEIINLFKNESGTSIEIEKVELIPSSNITAEISLNQCQDGKLAPGVECAISVAIQASQPGKFDVNILLNHDGRSRLTTATITGTVDAGSTTEAVPSLDELELDEPEIAFGTTNGGSGLVKGVNLNNASTKPITVNDVDLLADESTGFRVISDDCGTLTPGRSCLIAVRWAPKTKGSAQGVILVSHTGSSGIVKIPVSGTFDPDETEQAKVFPDPIPGLGLLISDRSAIDFGADIDNAVSITSSIINQGDAPVTLRSVALNGSKNGLTVREGGCSQGTVLLPSQACPLTVNWVPNRVGPVIDDLEIRHTGARGVLVLPVRGDAIAAAPEDQLLVTTRGSAEGVYQAQPTFELPIIPSVADDEIDDETFLGDDDDTAVTGNVDLTLRRATEPPALPEQYITTRKPVQRSPQQKYQAEISGYPPGYLASGQIKSLDGFRVTSHSSSRAVIAGPRGRLVVNDGEVTMIGGGRWIPRIVEDGVELIGQEDVVLLLFDRSFNAISSSSSSSGESSESADTGN